MKRYVIHLLILCVGAWILGIGCVFFIQAMLGSDAMTTFSQGLSVVFPLSLSLCYAGLNFMMFAIALVIDYHQVGLGTLLFPLVSAKSIDVMMNYIHVMDGYIRYLGFVFGLLLIAFAVALSSKVTCGKNPNDAMNFALMGLFKKPYNLIRGIVDALMLIFGIIMGGTWGIGTVIAVLSVGTIAMYFMKWMDTLSWVDIVLMSSRDV